MSAALPDPLRIRNNQQWWIIQYVDSTDNSMSTYEKAILAIGIWLFEIISFTSTTTAGVPLWIADLTVSNVPGPPSNTRHTDDIDAESEIDVMFYHYYA